MNIVKALIGQRNDTELPTAEEISVLGDMLASKGLSFEGLNSYKIEKIGGVIKTTLPNYSIKPTYLNENLIKVEYFNGVSQITENRILSCDISYTADLITSETWKVYDTSDGATVLVTNVIGYVYTDSVVTNIQVSEY